MLAAKCDSLLAIAAVLGDRRRIQATRTVDSGRLSTLLDRTSLWVRYGNVRGGVTR